jgi:uncharacterized protein YndB with AHSA1/START domain
MGPVSAEIEIDAPRAEVSRVLSDLARRPSFTDHFMSDFHLTRVDSSGVGAGARFRFAVPLRGMWMDGVIVESEQPRRLVERGCGGPVNRIQSIVVWELEQGPGSLTTVHVCHRLESSRPVDGVVDALTGASLWYERGWRKALHRLRDQLESGATPPRRAAVAGASAHMSVLP